MAPEEIRALREREQVSQPVFASDLNVRKDAVSKWEHGEKRPDGPQLVVLSAEEYARLARRDRRVILPEELTEEEAALIAQAEMPAEYAYLDAEVADWRP